jgi:uncharacterized membrane protein
MFILISGFCMGLKQEGRALWRDCKRGLIVLAAGILITIATLLFSPQTKIIFGVLFFLGISMILTAMMRSPLQKIPPFIGMLCVGVLFFVLRNINDGNLGFEGIVLCPLPNFLYEQGLLATFFGFQDKNFFSTDYFSLIPWYFLFLAGYFLCRCFLEKNSSAALPEFFKKGIPVFKIIGQHSLPVYLLHQPVILLLLSFIL